MRPPTDDERKLIVEMTLRFPDTLGESSGGVDIKVRLLVFYVELILMPGAHDTIGTQRLRLPPARLHSSEGT
jgi:hypothetical protein